MNIDGTKKSIRTYMETNYSQFIYYFGPVPEDEQLPRNENGEVDPLFIIRFGKINRGGRAVAGHRYDEYNTWMNLVCVGTDLDPVSEALDLLTDGLTGFRPVDGSPLYPNGGDNDYSMRNYASRPTLAVQSQRFLFGVNASPTKKPEQPPLPGP